MPNFTRKHLTAMLWLVLAVVTFAVYLPMLGHGFINFDDPDYITNNPHVKAGLTWPGIAWAFQIGYAAYWQPLTWLSHMMDCDLYGLNPAGHHLTNLLFHIANTLLLFFLLNRLTGAVWRSFFVAALFAWHPLRVESVAWAAERKDVLSAFFWMLTLIAYTRFVNLSKAQSPKSKVFYTFALFFFACGLMSKPMVVTLPFVLLLLDFWPLKRFSDSTVQHLLLEKIPFLALAFADSTVMFIAQKGNPSVWSLTELPISFRIENVFVSYLRYILKIFWPTNLALIYPYPHHWPAALVIASATLLVTGTAFSFWRIKKNPYLAVGWLWFLGTLAPVIGIMQVGMQSIADRFSYLPGIGIFIMVVWGVNDLLNSQPKKIKIAALAGGSALAACLAATSIQLNYWQDSIKLFSHAIEVTSGNYAADNCLGNALEQAGEKKEALACYAESVRVEPDYPLGQFNLGMMLLENGKADEGFAHLAIAAKLMPRDPVLQFDLGVFLLQHGKPDEAANHFKTALADKPDFPEARQQLDLLSAKTNSPANRSTH